MHDGIMFSFADNVSSSMSNNRIFSATFSFLCLLMMLAPSLSAHHVANPWRQWELLGKRVVNFSTDRDVIAVTAREGSFKALQLKVKGAPIDLTRMVVHFANGEEQVLQVRRVIPAGGQSPILDLPGNNRVITKVVLVYDTRNRARRRATVELWGRH